MSRGEIMAVCAAVAIMSLYLMYVINSIEVS